MGIRKVKGGKKSIPGAEKGMCKDPESGKSWSSNLEWGGLLDARV